MKHHTLIKRHPDGTFYARPYLGIDKITKTPIRPYKRFPKAKTEAEAEKMAQAWFEKQRAAAKFGVSGRLCELLDCYIDMLEGNKAPVNTTKTYRSILNSYIKPHAGKMRIVDFTAPVVQGLYNVVLMQESRKGGQISANTVLKMHWFLAGAFKYFCTNGICTHNPMPSVSKPHPEIKEAKAYGEKDFARIITRLLSMLMAPADTPDSQFVRQVAFATWLALWHGTRVGETCALGRDDVQLWRSNMHVHCTMVEPGRAGEVIRQEKIKGKKSRNLAIFSECTETMREQIEWQDRNLLVRDDVTAMLCRMPDGSFMRPSDLSRAYSSMIRDELKLDKSTSFHTLRHTHATWMLLNGADIVTVKERLGHAKESTTLEKYGHLMPGRDQAAVEVFGQFVASLQDEGGEQE